MTIEETPIIEASPVAKQLAPRKLQVTRIAADMAIEPPVWVRLVPYLQEALRYCHGELSESSIKALVAADRQQIWVALAGEGAELLGVILTEVTEYPLDRANDALEDLRAGRFTGAAVVVPSLP